MRGNVAIQFLKRAEIRALGYDWCGCLEPSALDVIVYLDIRYKLQEFLCLHLESYISIFGLISHNIYVRQDITLIT